MAIDNKRIAKNTLFLYFRMMVAMAASMVTAGVTMRVLGKVNYGLYAVLGGVVAMFSFMNEELHHAQAHFIGRYLPEVKSFRKIKMRLSPKYLVGRMVAKGLHIMKGARFP